MEWLIPIIICVLAGVILLIVEAFMPGFGVPGISGIILLLAGVAMTWYEYGAMVGLGTTVAVLALVGVAISVSLKSASSGRLSKSDLILNDTETPPSENADMQLLVGKEGVVKNTLVRFALNNVGLEGLDDVLNGTTSLAVSKDDPIAPMRIVNKYAKQMGDRFNIKAGFMDGKVIPLEDVAALAELPSKEVLQAQVLGTMLAPITSLAIVLKAIAEKNGGFVEAEAPAAE